MNFFNISVEGNFMSLIKQCQNERGAALVISLVFMTILTLLGSTAVVLTTTDMQIGANYKTSAQAFYVADAGATYAIAMIEKGLKAGTFTAADGDSLQEMDIGETISLAAFALNNSDFKFSYEAPGLTKIAENRFSFTTTGVSTNNGTTTISATCQQGDGISFAAWGDKKLDIKSFADITSYNSNIPSVSNPLTATTHESDIGSNEWLRTGNSSSIDGNGVLGEDLAGNDATNAISDPNDFYGNETPVDEERVDPDPLGVNSGGEYDPTTYAGVAGVHNNNDLAYGLVGDTIAASSEATLYDTPAGGTANYYLTSIIVGNGGTLTIDTSRGGYVRVFLTGAIDLKNGSNILMIPTSYDSTKFAIFSNSTDKISIKNSADFTGLIYAPYSTNVDVMNGADFYGAVWGSNVELKNSGDIRYDSALADKYKSKEMEMTTWQDFRN